MHPPVPTVHCFGRSICQLLANSVEKVHQNKTWSDYFSKEAPKAGHGCELRQAGSLENDFHKDLTKQFDNQESSL